MEDVRLHEKDGMLLVGELKQHPVLATMSVITAATGTTFAVTTEQEGALMEMW